MICEAKLDKIVRNEKLIQRKDAEGKKVDDKEVYFTANFVMKKQKLDRDENVKEGTCDPWVRISISSFDEKTFVEFKDMKMGDPVMISVDIA